MAKKMKYWVAGKTEAKIRHRYSCGVSVKDLANEFQIKAGQVRNILGISTTKMNDADLAEKFRRGMGICKISETFGFSTDYISKCLKNYFGVDKIKKTMLWNDAVFIGYILGEVEDGGDLLDISRRYRIPTHALNKLIRNNSTAPEMFIDQRVKDMIGMLRAGDTLEGIAENHGLTRERVRQLMNDGLGYKKYQILLKESRIARRIREEEPVAALIKNGASMNALVNETQLPRKKIREIAKDHLSEEEYYLWIKKYRNKDNKTKRLIDGTDQRHKEVVALRRAGFTHDQIMKKTGYSKPSVVNICRRFLSGEERGEIKSRAWSPLQKRREIADAFIGGLSMIKISNKTGMAPETIKKYVLEFMSKEDFEKKKIEITRRSLSKEKQMIDSFKTVREFQGMSKEASDLGLELELGEENFILKDAKGEAILDDKDIERIGLFVKGVKFGRESK